MDTFAVVDVHLNCICWHGKAESPEHACMNADAEIGVPFNPDEYKEEAVYFRAIYSVIKLPDDYEVINRQDADEISGVCSHEFIGCYKRVSP
jgi:hypothetical protein